MIQNAYGMFGLQLLPQMIIVSFIANNTINCRIKDENGKAVVDDECLKAHGLNQFYSNLFYLWINIVLAVCAVVIVVCKKKDKGQLPYLLAMLCWATQIIGLSQVAGYFATQSKDARIELLSEITALSLAIIAFFFGGKLINYMDNHEVRSLGSMFLVLSFLLILVLIISSILNLGGM